MKSAHDLDWNQARALLATVETGSLSAAARQLGLTQPTLGRQVAALEEALGIALFERVGRGLVLTPAGQALVVPLTAMGEAAEQLRLKASWQSQAMEGVVRITASDVYAVHVLAPALRELRHLAPGLVVDVLASNEVEDLIRRRADIALRHVPPREPELIARRCRDTQARIYGAPAYIEKIGPITCAEDLRQAHFIGFSDRNEGMIAELRRHGVPVDASNFPLMTASPIVALEWARLGLGLVLLMEAVGSQVPDIADAWPGFDGVPVPMWLATHRELRTSKKIRLVYDVLARFLAS